MTDWVRLDDDLPPMNEYVLIHSATWKQPVRVSFRHAKERHAGWGAFFWHEPNDPAHHATHWREIPPLPEGGAER